MRTKAQPNRRVTAFQVNLNQIIKDAEEHPNSKSCVVIDVISKLFEEGWKASNESRHKSTYKKEK